MQGPRNSILTFPRQAGLLLATLLFAALLPALSADRVIYPAPEQARTDLAAGLKSAQAAHKRVILDFGGNWCADCVVLDQYFHDAANRPILDRNFVLVHINIGHKDENLELAARYQIPVDKGVPALAVLDQNGKLLHSQKDREFISMRKMESGSVTTFLMQWRAPRAGCSAVQINC
jgi:thiol:disulfide interchange protein